MKILLLNPNYITRPNWGHQLFKNEFAKHHDVTFYGPGYPGYDSNLNVKQILKRLGKKFDIIFTYEVKYSKCFKGLGKITDIPKVHFQIDYAINLPNYTMHANTKNIDSLLLKNKPDLIFFSSQSNVDALKASLGLEKVFILPFSVDITKYRDLKLKRNIDAMAVYSAQTDIYPNRLKVQHMIQRMNITSFTKRVLHNNYIRYLNQSKIFVMSGGLNKRLAMKYTEAMACGAMVLSDEPEDLNIQGFVPGKHLILYNDLNDMKKKLLYYLKRDKERNIIARDGMEFVRNNHSCARRVKQFTKIVKRELNI